MRTIILRAGDFFGGGRGSWFDLVIAKEIGRGRLTYPGPIDLVHEWAYLPDLAAATVRLAAVRATLPTFETLRLSRPRGHRPRIHHGNRAGERARAAGEAHDLVAHPRAGPIMPISRELSEMAYLWNEPAPIDGGKLQPRSERCRIPRLTSRSRRALEELGAVGRDAVWCA